MTGEEAIKIFNTVLLFGKCDCSKEECEECFRMAIKALEQEPILDKIRAEIEALHVPFTSAFEMKRNVLEIIDKYKSESDIEKRKPCINYEDGCEEWAGCPCVYYKAENEVSNGNDDRTS